MEIEQGGFPHRKGFGGVVRALTRLEQEVCIGGVISADLEGLDREVLHFETDPQILRAESEGATHFNARAQLDAVKMKGNGRREKPCEGKAVARLTRLGNLGHAQVIGMAIEPHFIDNQSLLHDQGKGNGSSAEGIERVGGRRIEKDDVEARADANHIRDQGWQEFIPTLNLCDEGFPDGFGRDDDRVEGLFEVRFPFQPDAARGDDGRIREESAVGDRVARGEGRKVAFLNHLDGIGKNRLLLARKAKTRTVENGRTQGIQIRRGDLEEDLLSGHGRFTRTKAEEGRRAHDDQGGFTVDGRCQLDKDILPGAVSGVGHKGAHEDLGLAAANIGLTENDRCLGGEDAGSITLRVHLRMGIISLGREAD